MRAYPLFLFDSIRNVEVFYIEFDAGVLHESLPHLAGVEEYIFLVHGTLKMTIGEKEVLLQEKQSLRFGADIFHVYHNDSDRDCAVYNILSEQLGGDKMYELEQVSEKCYYINCPAKIGVYVPDKDHVYLVDSGNDKDAGRKVKKILDKNGWHLTAILNTHSNADHIGGNKYRLHQQQGNSGEICCFVHL